MVATRKPTRQGIIELLRRICIVLIVLTLWAAAIGFGVLNAQPYTLYFVTFGLPYFIAQMGAWGTWGAFQLVQMYPSFVANQGRSNTKFYRRACWLRTAAFAAEAVIQMNIWLPMDRVFAMALPELAMALVTVAGTVFAAALALTLTLEYTAAWSEESASVQTVNTTARGV